MRFNIERWRALEDPRYEVSSWGNVRKNGKLKTITKTKAGYLATSVVHGTTKKRQVHILVLRTFRPNPAPWHSTESTTLTATRPTTGS